MTKLALLTAAAFLAGAPAYAQIWSQQPVGGGMWIQTPLAPPPPVPTYGGSCCDYSPQIQAPVPMPVPRPSRGGLVPIPGTNSMTLPGFDND